jgi:hypothetical protein
MPIHHIEMDCIRTGELRFAAGVSQVAKICRE